MPENISGVPAGRSVFHLTSPFIGLLARVDESPYSWGVPLEDLVDQIAAGVLHIQIGKPFSSMKSMYALEFLL
jgi:hypothetical protein